MFTKTKADDKNFNSIEIMSLFLSRKSFYMTFELFTKMATDGVVMSYRDLFNGMTFRDIIPENIEHYVLKSMKCFKPCMKNST